MVHRPNVCVTRENVDEGNDNKKQPEDEKDGQNQQQRRAGRQMSSVSASTFIVGSGEGSYRVTTCQQTPSKYTCTTAWVYHNVIHWAVTSKWLQLTTSEINSAHDPLGFKIMCKKIVFLWQGSIEGAVIASIAPNKVYLLLIKYIIWLLWTPAGVGYILISEFIYSTSELLMQCMQICALPLQCKISKS
jgi:hypothetical protein